MKGIGRLNLALLVVVIALALFAYWRSHKTEAENKLSIIKPAEARTVRIEITGSPPVVLERGTSEWKMTAPVMARADSFQIQRLLDILEATSKDRYSAAGLARYDLNEPYARVTVNQQTFAFGAVNEMSREQYVLTQGGIYPVALRYAAALPKNALQMVSKQLFGADEAPVGFDLDAFKVVQNDGKWTLTPPAADGSADDINRWVDEWRLANATGIQPASNGKPLSNVRVKLKNGSDINIGILQREPQLVLARSDQQFEYQFPGELAKRLLASPAAPPQKK